MNAIFDKCFQKLAQKFCYTYEYKLKLELKNVNCQYIKWHWICPDVYSISFPVEPVVASWSGFSVDCRRTEPNQNYWFFINIHIPDSGRRMHTVMNVYIGNLALADVIIALFCIPFQFQAALLNRWDLPAFMCKLCPFLQVSILFENCWIWGNLWVFKGP